MFPFSTKIVSVCLVCLCACLPAAFGQSPASPDALRRLAADYYQWRNENGPVASSDRGLHTWDSKLTDYSPAALRTRAEHTRTLLAQVRAMEPITRSWSRDYRIGWLLFRSQLEGQAFNDRVLRSTETDPQTYVGECSSAIFSLLKKNYDTPKKRALAATARLKQMPGLIEEPEEPSSSLWATGNRLSPRHRSTIQGQPDDSGGDADAGRAQ